MRNTQPRHHSLPIRSNGRFAGINAVLLLGTFLLIGCGSGKTTVEGYEEAALTNKRVFVLLPAQEQIELANPAAFASSRGIGEAGGAGRVSTEFRTDLPTALDARMSNTFLEYGSQTVGAVVPLNPTSDLPKGTTATWDWTKVREAAKQGNIDYLLVFHTIRVENEMPKEGASRGKETVVATFSLLDPNREKVMTTDEIRVEIKDPRKPVDTYTRVAEALSKKLPFQAAQ